ncbi:MAG: VLRF1 family aeRF1-type release factor [Thermoanaerobaculia bacterium]|nr:VLRF1 family aeRF1-type release factor [Thermoanaerobaculia bacterium]
MLDSIDLRSLAEMSGPERAFLTLYLSSPDAIGSLDDRADRIRRLLAGEEAELEHFERSYEMIRETLDENEIRGPMAIFASWALDYLLGIPLDIAPDDRLWIDSSPYIRPLAELQDEYEMFVVVTADNDAAEIHLVSEMTSETVERVKGDVKNRVRKGGWSQKRYQRRRENELLHYAKEVVEVLEEVVSEEEIERIVLLGQDEALDEIEDAMPESLRKLVAGRDSLDLDSTDEEVVDRAMPLYFRQERDEEASTWDRIREEALSDGLAVLGPSAVLAATREGRAEEILVLRDLELYGMRCRECETLAHAKPQQCPQCQSPSVFVVDLVNEITELASKTSATVDFADPLEGWPIREASRPSHGTDPISILRRKAVRTYRIYVPAHQITGPRPTLFERGRVQCLSGFLPCGGGTIRRPTDRVGA